MPYFAALLCLAGQEFAVAQKLKLPNPLVVNGEAFINPIYESHDASRLNIMHKTGAASLPIAQLPDGLPKKLGYNSRNAFAAEQEILKRQEEAETQSKIELSKMLEKERAASRRVDIVDRNAAKIGTPIRYYPNRNSHVGYPPPRSAVTQASTGRGEPLTASDAIRSKWGWGPSPLASNEELARFHAHTNPVRVSEESTVQRRGSSHTASRSSATVRTRSASGFDYSGNFYTGSVGPSGSFSGFRQGPSGAAIIFDNFDQLGGWSRPY